MLYDLLLQLLGIINVELLKDEDKNYAGMDDQ